VAQKVSLLSRIIIKSYSKPSLRLDFLMKFQKMIRILLLVLNISCVTDFVTSSVALYLRYG